MAANRGLRIGINLLPYAHGWHGGAENYLTNLAIHLAVGYPEHTLALIGRAEALSRFDDAHFEKYAIAKWDLFAKRWGRVLYEQAFLWRDLHRYRLDCLISNYVLPIPSSCPAIVVVHDMLYARYPEAMELPKLWYWRLMVPLSIRRSRSVVTVSNFSKREICEVHPFAKNKIFVTVEGINPELAQYGNGTESMRTESEPFLLSVATFGKHKNLEMLIYALTKLRSMGYLSLKLVMVGAARTPDAKKVLSNIKGLTWQFGLDQDVRILGHVSARDLAGLYQRARALVVPSLYEGFGLPVIEAQFFGCPVICSNRAALPEIAGNAAIFFEPSSIDSLVEAIAELESNTERREYLIQAGRENVKRFSWQKAANQMMDAVNFSLGLR
ncbi:MAG: glycosyltransferase family 1 protein [Candidatus Methanomethylicaceae archaeon]